MVSKKKYHTDIEDDLMIILMFLSLYLFWAFCKCAMSMVPLNDEFEYMS
jgi:hypothetical protein